MPLIEPKIDDKTYQEILSEALVRVRIHNPAYTNISDADPGMTLIQLFAFMTQSLMYRSNQIPKRNKIKFLKLLRIPMKAAEPARGIITFNNGRGPFQAVVFSSGMELFAGQIPYRTLDGLYVLPVEARVYYKSRLSEKRKKEMEALYEQLYGSFKDSDTGFEMYETRPLEPPTGGIIFPIVDLAKSEGEGAPVDGSLWVVLLARQGDSVKDAREAIANKILTIGILPELADASRVLQPEGKPSEGGEFSLIYEIPARDPLRGWMLPTDRADLPVAKYSRLEYQSKGDPLIEPSLVNLTLPGMDDLGLWENLEPLEQGVSNFPPSLEDTTMEKRVITWIRIRLRPQDDAQKKQLKARLSWVGINAARITQKVHVSSEILGKGTGEPDQSVTLVHKPVIPESLELRINGELWYEIDDLMAAEPEVPIKTGRLQSENSLKKIEKKEVNVYTLDRESGEIRFGDGLRGARPPLGMIIQASYDYGGGVAGNVGIGAINKCPLLPAGMSITNPIPTWGGDEPETMEEAEKRIPAYLRHRDRLVSIEDFKDITSRTPGMELGRVEVLPLFHPDMPDDTSHGVVTIMVIPKNDPIQPEAPLPDRLFLDTVCGYINPRRLVTTEVHVCGPEYVPIWVSVGIDVIPGMDIPPVLEAVKKEIRKFLSPLSGGFEGNGWPLKRDVEVLELLTAVTRVPGVSKVVKVLLADSNGPQAERVQLKGLQLPHLTDLAVQQGIATDIKELRGYPGRIEDQIPSGGVKVRVVPVPVIPPEFRC